MAAGGTSGGNRCPRLRCTPGSLAPASSPLHLLERATAIEEELAQGQESPSPRSPHCHSGDAVATGHQPPAFLRQVAAICAHPELLGDGSIPADAKNRAGRVLRHLQGGSPGAYNLEYVTDAVAEKVARYLERRDGGTPGDPRCVVPCGGTAAAMVVSVGMGTTPSTGGGGGEGTLKDALPDHSVSSRQDVLSLLVDAGAAVPTGVLVPVPGPPLLWGATGLAGAVAVPYPLDEERGCAVDAGVRGALRRGAGTSCHPKVLCVVNPGDPTGHVLSRQNMEDIVRLAAEENLLLLADEVGRWWGAGGSVRAPPPRSRSGPRVPQVQQERAFLPGRPFLSFKRVLWEMGAPLLPAVQLVSFYSLSKGVGGGGFRAGFFELVNIDPSLKCFYSWGLSVYPSILGGVLESAMEPPLPSDPSFPAFEEHRQAAAAGLAHNARLVQEVLGRAPGIRCRPVQGGARAFPRIQLPPRAQRQARALGLEPDVFFCQKLLEATGIVLAQVSEFGQPEGTHHVGLSLLLPAATLERVLLFTRFHATFLRDFS
ncbi:LOW QUALITY PROTEIN: alanine aminotransferase 1-like [Alca torda]